MPQMNVHIKQEDHDKQEIDSLSCSLRDDLLNLDVEEVHLLHEKAPPGSKALDGVAIGSMIVDFVSGGAIKEVTQTVQAWIQRNENRSITIEMGDGEKIDVKGISSKDQQKMIDAWVMRQMQKMIQELSEGNRVALIVACDRYADPDLKQLQAPSQDAERFARILKDPNIGNFKVTSLINEPYYTIKEKIDEFVQSCNREDTILLYFSCHGIKDKNGQLYFATITTNRKRLSSTGIDSNFVNNMLDQCRAQQKVVLLDCCYSGAFEKGRVVRADEQVNATEFFGKGSVIITASDGMQYAFEGDDKIENLGKGG